MAVVLVHNHPANAGLSAADTQQLAKPGVAAIVAVGHDGSVFIASAGPRLNRDFFEMRSMHLPRPRSGRGCRRIPSAKRSRSPSATRTSVTS